MIFKNILSYIAHKNVTKSTSKISVLPKIDVRKNFYFERIYLFVLKCRFPSVS